MMYLQKYPLKDQFETYFELTTQYARSHIWTVIEKIQHLKFQKVNWPDDFAFADIWVMSVDGTHVWIEEPSHEIYSMDLEYFSHKFNKAGINYKLGIALNLGELLWMNESFKAGKNDLKILAKKDWNNDFCFYKRKQLETVVIGDTR